MLPTGAGGWPAPAASPPGVGEDDAAWTGWLPTMVMAAAGGSVAVLLATAVALVAGWWTGATYF